MTIPNLQLLQWAPWGLSLLAGIGAIIALFKLRIAERFLPPWNELKELEATLPVRREELRQVTEVMQSDRQELAKLEGEVGELRQLREWQHANPDAPARIQQMMVDLERGKAELTAVQQKLAQDEAALNEITREVKQLTQEKTQLTDQMPAIRDQLAALYKQKSDLEKAIRDHDDERRQF
jgi:chromosome segregation ATPase